jgi:hypothetical protein
MPIMRRKFLRSLVVVFAAFAAMFMAIHQDDLREFDTAYVQREVLRESRESLLAQSDRQAVYFPQFASSGKGGHIARSVPITPSPTLSAFSTCVLLC